MRPLITFALFAYNQERFIRKAVEGAFSQTYSPLEIILSDDCSDDRTFEIMKEMTKSFQGGARVVLNRNAKNLGLGSHINKVMQIASGELIVVAAGDDISVPNRVERTYDIYEKTKAKSLFANCLTIDENGNSSNLLFQQPLKDQLFSAAAIIQRELSVAGCSHAWTKDVFEVFGPLLTPLVCEDRVIPLRSALLGRIVYIDEVLVMHRVHSKNAWNYKLKRDIDKDISFERFWIYEVERICRNWLKDLKIMEKMNYVDHSELSYLQALVSERLNESLENISMLRGSLPKRLKILSRRLVKRGNSFKRIRHDIGFYLMPQAYRAYLALKSKAHFRKNVGGA